MRELLFGFTILCSIHLYAQIDYFESNPEWRVDYFTPSGDPDCLIDLHQRDYSINGDSIHSNGYTYKKFSEMNVSSIAPGSIFHQYLKYSYVKMERKFMCTMEIKILCFIALS